MKKKQIITIAGRLGSGKSSTAKLLADRLGYEHFSSGDLFRDIANSYDQSVLDANVAAEKDATIDHLVDQKLRDIGEREDNKVVDSRTAWHWMPQSFKVYLDLPTVVAAARIIQKKHERGDANEEIPDSIHEYAALLDARYNSENRRYKTLYAIDPSLSENYDLVINTEEEDLQQVVERIFAAYQAWRANA